MRTNRLGSVLLVVLSVAGCSSTAPEPIWIGHLATLERPRSTGGGGRHPVDATDAGGGAAKDRTVAGRYVGVRHADSAHLARAEAVRLLAVNQVVGLILGPGLADPEDVAASARSHEAAVVVLDETPVAPLGPAVRLLGADPARRGRALAHLARTKLMKKRVALLIDRRNGLCAALGQAFAAAWRPEGELREWPVAEAAGLPAIRSDLAAYAPDAVLAAVPAAFLPNLPAILPLVPILYGGPDVDEDVLRAKRQAERPSGSCSPPRSTPGRRNCPTGRKSGGSASRRTSTNCPAGVRSWPATACV